MVTEKETVKAPETATTKIEETPEFKEALRRATSKYQQQASEARRSAKQISTRIQALEQDLQQSKQDAEVARLAGDDVDAAARLKEQIRFRDEIDKKQKLLVDREEQVRELERRSSIRLLHEEYGIPIGDLEDYETLAEMEIASLKYEREERKKNPKTTQKAGEEERETKPLDTAEGRLAGLILPAPGTKEFEDLYSKVKANFSR